MKPVEKGFPDAVPEALRRELPGISSCTIAFSGGTDSSLLVALMARILPPTEIHAVTFRSWLHFEREMERTVTFCSDLGVNHDFIEGPEMKIRGVIYNMPERCALCKEARVKALLKYSFDHGTEVVMDGSNADDLKDPTRLGTRILAKYPQVLSPLARAGITKKHVREIARILGIPWWNESATACLATRFPENTKLEIKELQKTAEMENSLRDLGLDTVRIRNEEGSLRIEVPDELMEKALRMRKEILSVLSSRGCKKVSLDLQGYRTVKDKVTQDITSGG